MAWNYAAVKWTTKPDTLTVTMLKSCRFNHEIGPVQKSWKNYCPGCKKSGVLVAHSPGNKKNGNSKDLSKWGNKFAPEGEITCNSCGYDACGICGRGKDKKTENMRLTPAGSVNSPTPSTSSVANASCELSRAEAIAKGKKLLEANKVSDFKADATFPLLKNMRPGQKTEFPKDYFPRTRQTQFFIRDLKLDISNQTASTELFEKYNKPTTEYKPPSTPSSPAAPVTPPNNNIPIPDGNSAIEKKILLQGAKLKSFSACKSWAMTGTGGGGFNYLYYWNWCGRLCPWSLSDGPLSKFNAPVMNKVWSSRKANCVAFAWLLYTLCRGAGIKIEIWNGNATFPNGRYGHLWNRYNGNIHDCSSRSARNYKGSRIV